RRGRHRHHRPLRRDSCRGGPVPPPRGRMAADVTADTTPPPTPPPATPPPAPAPAPTKGEVTDMGRVQRLVRFVLVGGVGFVVSTAVLAMLVGQGLPNFVASLLATETAIIGNYLLHEVFTFGTRQLSWRRLGTYNLAAALGLVITAVAFDLISRSVPDWPLVVRNLGA